MIDEFHKYGKMFMGLGYLLPGSFYRLDNMLVNQLTYHSLLEGYHELMGSRAPRLAELSAIAAMVETSWPCETIYSC